MGSMFDSSLAQIEEKVDVNVYFVTDASEDEILRLRSVLEGREDVSAVEYISQEQALTQFRSQHRSDDLIIQALEELEANPLRPHFNIQATSPDRYAAIVNFLESDSPAVAESQDIIDQVNYQQNEAAINRLSNIIQSLNALSFIVILVFAIIAGLIVFNTIRLGIYSSRDEISVMELMGASRVQIRGPFVIEGVMYGIVAALVTLLLFYPLSLWVGSSTQEFFGAVSAFDYFINNFAQLFLILVVSGIILGGLSSYIAVQKYLDV